MRSAGQRGIPRRRDRSDGGRLAGARRDGRQQRGTFAERRGDAGLLHNCRNDFDDGDRALQQGQVCAFPRLPGTLLAGCVGRSVDCRGDCRVGPLHRRDSSLPGRAGFGAGRVYLVDLSRFQGV